MILTEICGRGTDCRGALRLADGADRVVRPDKAEQEPCETGRRTPRAFVPLRSTAGRRPLRSVTAHAVGRGPRAPPKNAYPAAGHMGPALQVHTPPKKQRGAPCGAPSPTGGAMWASSPTERRRGVPYRRRSQDMLATARPPMRTVTAPSFSYRTLRISDGRDMCSPCRNTFSSPGFTSPRR